MRTVENWLDEHFIASMLILAALVLVGLFGVVVLKAGRDKQHARELQFEVEDRDKVLTYIIELPEGQYSRKVFIYQVKPKDQP